MTVLVTLIEVASRGRIGLASGDPRHRPQIDPDYLSDVRDLSALAIGVRMARDYGTAAPMSKICVEELSPGDGANTDQELRDYIRASVVSGYHPVGTCAMGGESRWSSVVDPELRVRGVTGLRVVDASVMPSVPRGNTNAPTIAIAERAADLIAGRAPLAAVDPADPVDAMVIAPCSIHTMSAIAHGITSNLLTRAADVTLKERRKLILMVRESPFHLGHLRSMTALAEMGAIIAPPIPGFYHHPQSVLELVDHSLDRVLDLLGLPDAAIQRWEGPDR